jgi:signal transduction histidine kinase
MPLKFKIIHKGLTLIAVPLIFGIAFGLLLLHGLAECNQKCQHELRLKDAMIAGDVIMRRLFAARICAVSYFASKDDYFKESFTANIADAIRRYKYLQGLLKNESFMQKPMEDLKREIKLNSARYRVFLNSSMPGTDLSRLYGMRGHTQTSMFFSMRPAFLLVEQLQDYVGNEARAVVSSMNRLQLSLVGGLLCSVFITIVLSIYFSLNITVRLLKIVDNTMRLSKGLPLNSPVKGQDEIAELDQFLYKSANEIRELESFKKELIGVVSHELKSPLSSVEGFLGGFAAGVFGELSNKARDKAERAHKSIKRLMGLVMELLDLDRLESGKFDMNPAPVSVNEIVTASVDAVRELSERSGVVIETKIAGEQVFADRGRLVQVVVNLLSNAMKFSPPGGIVTVEASQLDGCLQCRVSDQGRGIPEAFRKEIFEPFKQVDGKDATSKKGTGLGLTISRSIVEQHGGKIGVDSVEGQGSTFWFKIPLGGDAPACDGAGDLSAQLSGSSVEAVSPLRHSSGFRGGRFNILQKGLILVSVPLIFQIGFVSVISCLFQQIREQVRREEQSKEIVDAVNRMEEKLTKGIGAGTMYVATQDAELLRSWRTSKQDAFLLFERAQKLSAADAGQRENVRKIGEWLTQSCDALDKMVNTKETDLAILLRNSGLVKNARPLQASQPGQEGLLSFERETGEKLASQRMQMLRNLETALAVGIILNMLVSTCLAFYLMRSITSRLRHVMTNTARLVGREPLELPIKGSDEIAYLDRIFYEAGKHLVELETFKRELISIVSHELRTPLMAVLSSLELFSAGAFGELTEKASQRLKIAEEETNRLIRLINNLLDIEKMEAGKFILDSREVSVSEILERSISAVAGLAERAEIKLEVLPADCVIQVDCDRICQVIINLLSNAIKFSPAQGVVNIAVEPGDSVVEFRVCDQGRGVPDELKAKIFDRFVQVEKKDASERGGSGLGLAICRAIVEQHGGIIGVESKLGRGSTFWFRLPAGGTGQACPVPPAAPGISQAAVSGEKSCGSL